MRLASGYYPGSGTQNGFAVRGRMEYANREMHLTFVARAAKGSREFNALVSQTEGPVLITLTGALIGAGPETHGMRISAPRTVISSDVIGDAEGIVTVNCEAKFLKPTTGDIVSLEATTTKDSILGLV
jgi:hypothetical protein